MKVSSITSLQLLAAVAVAAPLTADFSSTSKVANAKRQGPDLPPAVENLANKLGLRDDSLSMKRGLLGGVLGGGGGGDDDDDGEEVAASVTKRQGDDDGLLDGILGARGDGSMTKRQDDGDGLLGGVLGADGGGAMTKRQGDDDDLLGEILGARGGGTTGA